MVRTTKSPNSDDRPVIVLLTDFGYDDPYVGQIKGVLHSLLPEAEIMDLSHGVPAFQVETGAFFLAASYPYFPTGAMFLAVVDPGVGTEREILCMQGRDYTFIAPDNGLLSLAFIRHKAHGDIPHIWRLDPRKAEAAAPAAGQTFAGRDIISPLAARLTRGETPDELGEPVPLENLLMPLWAAPERQGNQLLTTVLHVDFFGNVILNLPLAEWQPALHARDLWLVMSSAGAQAALPITQAATYAQLLPGKVGIIPGGQGFLELALNQSSAARELNLKPGDLIRLGIG